MLTGRDTELVVIPDILNPSAMRQDQFVNLAGAIAELIKVYEVLFRGSSHHAASCRVEKIQF